MSKRIHGLGEEDSFNLPPDKRLLLWKSRSLLFRLQHRWNVLSFFLRGRVTWRSAWLGLKYPEQVMWLAVAPPDRGMLPVCPDVIAELDHIDRVMLNSSQDKPSVEVESQR